MWEHPPPDQSYSSLANLGKSGHGLGTPNQQSWSQILLFLGKNFYVKKSNASVVSF